MIEPHFKLDWEGFFVIGALKARREEPRNPQSGAAMTLALEKAIRLRTDHRRKKIWQERRDHYRLLTENFLDILTVLSAEGIVEYQSPSIEKTLGYKPGEFVGKSILGWVHPNDLEHVRISMADRVQTPGPSPAIEFRVRHKNGSWRTLEAIANNLIFDSGVAGVIVTSRDISERKHMEEELRKAYNNMALLTRELEKANAELRRSNEQLSEVSRRDPLTGLWNRTAAFEIARDCFLEWIGNGTQFSVAIIDIDDFKLINDSFGHLNGDTALRLLTAAVTDAIGPGDIASRFGGDEFLVILSGAGTEKALFVGKRILAGLRANVAKAGLSSLGVTASIGVATVGLSDRMVDALLNRADTALYQAKKLGKDQVAIG